MQDETDNTLPLYLIGTFASAEHEKAQRIMLCKSAKHEKVQRIMLCKSAEHEKL